MRRTYWTHVIVTIQFVEVVTTVWYSHTYSFVML